MRQTVNVPQSVADAFALTAQTYVGFFVGHPVSALQWAAPFDGSVSVDHTKPWVEPNVLSDDCEFCEALTDDDAVRRVFGYQSEIDKETLSGHWEELESWLKDGSPDVLNQIGNIVEQKASHANRRRFIELYGHTWKYSAFPLVALPLRLKRKLCIEWNHIYTAWMQDEGVSYDWEKKEFWKDFQNLDEYQAVLAREWEEDMTVQLSAAGIAFY
jgi:hypothetical protein